MSLAAIVLTLASTLVVPLQQAVIFGVVVASVLFIYRSSTDVRLVNVSIQDGDLVHSELPVQLPGNQVTVIDVEGNLFCAGMRTLSERLADAAESHHVVAVLRIQGQAAVGSTFFKVVGQYAERIRENRERLILASVDDTVRERMLRTGNLDDIGPENVFVTTSVVGESTVAALSYGQQLLADPQSREMKGLVVDVLEVPAVAPASKHKWLQAPPVPNPPPIGERCSTIPAASWPDLVHLLSDTCSRARHYPGAPPASSASSSRFAVCPSS